jgi:hypothetical protein
LPMRPRPAQAIFNFVGAIEKKKKKFTERDRERVSM